MFFTKIASWFLSGGLSWIGKTATDLYGKKLEADNNSERIVAELAGRELAVEAKEAEFANKLLIAEQGNWATRWVRPAWSAPYVIWTWKVLVWDMCLHWGTTPDLKGFPAQLGVTIAASYFGGRSLEKVAQIIATKRGAK